MLAVVGMPGGTAIARRGEKAVAPKVSVFEYGVKFL